MLKRIWRLFTGKAETVIGEIESRNPEISIALAEKEINSKLQKAKDSLVKVVVNYKVAAKQVEDIKQKYQAINKNIEMAIKTRNEELLVKLYLEEKEMQKAVEFADKAFTEIQSRYDAAKKEYQEYVRQAGLKKVKLQSYKVMADANKARRAIRDSIEGMSWSGVGTSINLKSTEDALDKQKFELEALTEVRETDVLNIVKQLEVDAEVEEARQRAREALAG